MIVVVKHTANEQQVESLASWFHTRGLKTDISKGEFQTVIGLIGDVSKVEYSPNCRPLDHRARPDVIRYGRLEYWNNLQAFEKSRGHTITQTPADLDGFVVGAGPVPYPGWFSISLGMNFYLDYLPYISLCDPSLTRLKNSSSGFS